MARGTGSDDAPMFVRFVINPAAANGYEDLVSDAHLHKISPSVSVQVVSWRRVIESKRAVGRVKDQNVIPRMEQILEELERKEQEDR